MKQALIILDGPRGAGKSTVSELLKERLEDSVFIGLDFIRNLAKKAPATGDYNKIAYEAMESVADVFLKNGITVVTDSGLTQEREQALRLLAQKYQVPILQYSLSAPKEVLWDRIQKRGAERGRMPNPARFEETYAVLQSKDFSSFQMIDTTKTMPEEIADKVIADLNSL